MNVTRPTAALEAYLTFQYLTGQKTKPATLIEFVRKCGWSETFAKLAALAARMTMDPGGPTGANIRRLTVEPLRGLNPEALYSRQIIDGLNFHDEIRRPAVTAHEQVIYFLQALAILQGSDDGPPPNDVELALWLLVANDHVQGWLEPDDRDLPKDEKLVAEVTQLSRYNMFIDVLRPLTRIALMLEKGPTRPPLSEPETWRKLQVASLGRSFNDYMDQFVSPLIFSSYDWGAKNVKDFTGYTRPVLDKKDWLSKSTIPESEAVEFIDSISIDRAGAKIELQRYVDADGLPRSVALFYRYPFVLMPNGNVAAASPWALREQLRAGIWGKFRAGSDSMGFKKQWLDASGVLFEEWCRRVARYAARYSRFKGELLVSPTPGDKNEIEDVVVREGRDAALFSVKATFVREGISRVQKSRTAVIDYYENFFFKLEWSGPNTFLTDQRIDILYGLQR